MHQVKQRLARVHQGAAIISQRTPDLCRQLLAGRRVNIRNFFITYTHFFRQVQDIITDTRSSKTVNRHVSTGIVSVRGPVIDLAYLVTVIRVRQ